MLPSYQVVLWKQESFGVLRLLQIEFFRSLLGVVAVLLGNGDGTFQTAVSYNSGGYRDSSLSVADLNQDGKPDLIVANLCAKADSCDQGAIGVLLGNGDGTFQPAKSYSSGGGPVSIAVGDVNLDGRPDLAVVNGYPGNVAVLLGNGDGTFQTPRTYIPGGRNPSAIAIGDVNGDGKPDLVVTDICLDSGCMLGAVAVLLGNGDGTFLTAGTYSSGSYYPTSTALADIDGDGRLDALVIGERFGYGLKTAGMVGVLRGNGDGTFQPVQSYLSGGPQVLSIAIGDLNEDHRPDVVVANWCLPKTPCKIQNGPMGSVGVLTGMFGTTTSLSSNSNPSTHGRKVTFTAAVASAGPMPTGRVKFTDGTKGVGTVALKDGAARLSSASLAIGNHAIMAHYLGDNANAGSTSPVLNQLVQ
jgi:hypothetical protein